MGRTNQQSDTARKWGAAEPPVGVPAFINLGLKPASATVGIT
jgi:hypothetical protein